MGTVNKDTYKRLYLLAVVNQFPKAVFGRTRLQKTVYESAKNVASKPFSYFHYDHGQFSKDLCDIQDQLLSMNYISASPIGRRNKTDGNAFTIGQKFDREDIGSLLVVALGGAVMEEIEKAVNDVGFLPEDVLLRRMHEELDSAGISKYQSIFADELPDRVEIELDDETCDNLDLILNPNFSEVMSEFSKICAETDFDASKVTRTYSLGG